MLTIQIITPQFVKTITVAEVPDEQITYRPCAYCEDKLVRAPRKTCSDNCRKLASYHGIDLDAECLAIQLRVS